MTVHTVKFVHCFILSLFALMCVCVCACCSVVGGQGHSFAAAAAAAGAKRVGGAGPWAGPAAELLRLPQGSQGKRVQRAAPQVLDHWGHHLHQLPEQGKGTGVGEEDVDV